MIDVYSIGTTLKLNDLVTPQLLKLSEQFAKVDALTMQVNKRLKAMGAEVVGVRNLAAAAGKLDTGLKGVRDQALLAERALGGIKGSLPSGLGIEKELIAANAEAARLEAKLAGMRWNRVPGGGGGGMMPPLPNPGGGSGGGGRRHGPHGGNLHVGPGGFGVGGVGIGLMDSAMVPLAAGFAAAYVGHAFYESAKDYQGAFMRFRALNLGDKVDAEADHFARMARPFGVSKTELMSGMAESAGIFNSFDEVKKFAPRLAEIGKANAAIYGDKVGSLDDDGLKSLMKFIDRRGGTKDEATFARTLDLAEKLVTGSGGFLKFRDLGTFSQNAGTAFRSLSDEGLQHMEGLMIEQGGQKAGTALMSLYQNLVAGRTPKKTMGLLQDLGIATLQMQEHGSVGGKPMKSLVMTDVQGSDLLQSDPAKWMTDVLLPALAKKGITSEGAILKAVNDVLSNRNASNQGTIMTGQQMQVLRDQHFAQTAKNTSQVIDMFKDSPQGAEADFGSAWTDFKEQFGHAMLPAITKMLRDGASILRTISSADDNLKDEQNYVNQGDGLWGRMKRMWNWQPGMGTGDSHASKSVAPRSAYGGSPEFNLFLTEHGKRAIASSTTSFMGDHLGRQSTGVIDNSLSLPMPGLK